MRYVLSLFLAPALAAPALAQGNEAETLFRGMEKKLRGAKAFEVAFDYQLGTRKAKGELLVTRENQVRLKVSGAFEESKASFELISDGKKVKTKGAKFYVMSNGQPVVEPGGESEWPTTKNFQALLSGTLSRGGMWLMVQIMPYVKGEETDDVDTLKLKAYEFKLAGMEKVGATEAKVVHYRCGNGDGCPDDAEVTLWIDAKTMLPLKRSFVLKKDGPRVVENYQEFRLEPKIDAKAFALPK